MSRAASSALGVLGADATLFKLFAVAVDTDTELPVAAVTHAADSGKPQEGWWLRADPVHLYADLQQVLLFDARGLNIDIAEAQSLVAYFNRTFGAEGLSLKALHPERWYLGLSEDPGLRTLPLFDAIGRNIMASLPWGAAARDWRKRLTEVQMLFHTHEVNRVREADGRRSINSVWLWGGGVLPQMINPVNHDVVYADDPLAQGLARLAGVALRPVPETAIDWHGAAGADERGLVVLETTRYDPVDDNPAVWVEHVEQLEQTWFTPVLALLKNNRLDTLRLYPCEGSEYSMVRRDTWRFWRRPRSLVSYIRNERA